MMGTWYQAFPEIAFFGNLFAGMSIGGFVLLLASRPMFSFLIINLKRLLLTVLVIVIGLAVTVLLQTAILVTGWAPFLSAAPPDVQNVFLLESAIAETYLYFGLQAFFTTYLHPIVGVPIPPALAYFMHQFVYGTSAVFLTVVVVSFFIQSITYAITRRLSVPLSIHSGVNFVR